MPCIVEVGFASNSREDCPENTNTGRMTTWSCLTLEIHPHSNTVVTIVKAFESFS